MAKPDRKYITPTDLALFYDSPFAWWAERAINTDSGIKRSQDKFGNLLKKHGEIYEKEVLKRLKKRHGASHVEDITNGIDKKDMEKAVEKTRLAMKEGVPVIYQGALQYGRMRGYADFLIRVDGKERSTFGKWHYEPWDSKLSREPKPAYIIQLCAYIEMLLEMQKIRPGNFGLYLKNSEKPERSFRTEDYYYYYLAVRENYVAAEAEFSSDKPPIPQKRESLRGWEELAEQIIAKNDSLIQIAHITESQIRKLEDDGIHTMTILAEGSRGRPNRLSAKIFEKLQAQAKIQIVSKGKEKPEALLLPHGEDSQTGLRLLPPPCDDDIVLDLESYPLIEGGLVYLFGISQSQKGQPKYQCLWAHDSKAEKSSLEETIDFIYEQWSNNSVLHVYHYGSYDCATLESLVEKYDTRYKELDDLLRNHVFVNVHRIIRQAFLIGTPSYSLKCVEKLIGEARAVGVLDGGDSIVQYALWVEVKRQEILDEIKKYNETDCASTRKLVSWLHERQEENPERYGYVHQETLAEEPTLSSPQPNDKMCLEMLEKADSEPEEFRFLAQLMPFHRREFRPFWRTYFNRLAQTEEELSEDIECLAGLTLVKRRPDGSYELSFDPTDQETKLEDGDGGVFVHDYAPARYPRYKATPYVTIRSIEHENGIVVVEYDGILDPKIGRFHLIPFTFFQDMLNGVKASLLRTGAEYPDFKSTPAIRDFIFRKCPRLKDHERGKPITIDPKNPLKIALLAVERLESSILAVQGPPGTGKTTAAAEMILHLLQQKNGIKIGIAAFSHKAIGNVLRTIHEVHRKRQPSLFDFLPTIAKIDSYATMEEEDELKAWGVTLKRCSGADFFKKRHHQSYQVIAGTYYAFSNKGAERTLDYLFVDEAGQMSSANFVAMAGAAKNVILLGDQMQLPQVVQGSHPDGSDQSCLEYYLKKQKVVPPEMGLLLNISYRLHPELCDFIGSSFYQGEIVPAPGNERRVLEIPSGCNIEKEAGLIFISERHNGCTQSSDKEVERIARLIRELQKCKLVKENRKTPVKLSDILVVAPYNHQVSKLKRKLGKDARIGTVDKFQGQEAAIVIVSMCCSNGEESPRGLEFIFDEHRLNVAISRAQALAVVVGSPTLACTYCSTVERMKLVNLFCKIVILGSQTMESFNLSRRVYGLRTR
ncbi:MAG: TM0106 family RecB-like putative nuclease [Deltaproteobacteria bacterium]|nr:TM0106 family RecB-like putative nuclease [Deltaproteobacteria bacterium]